MAKLDLPSLAARVMSHAEATADYNGNGWDVVIECWTVEEIEAALREDSITTVKGALKLFSDLASVWADQQADAVNSAF